MNRFFLALIFVLSGCATGYGSKGFTGGYSETQLAPNVFVVDFKGNGWTSAERARDLAMLRSADLALQNGFRYFAVAGQENSSTTSFLTTPSSTTTDFSATAYGNTAYGTARSRTTGGSIHAINKPGRTMTIVCFWAPPDNGQFIFDAQFVRKSLGAKYGIQPASYAQK